VTTDRQKAGDDSPREYADMALENPDSVVIEGCAVATMDGAGSEYEKGHVVLERGLIAAVGPGPAPGSHPWVLDGRGCLATPGLINLHRRRHESGRRRPTEDARTGPAAEFTRLVRSGCSTTVHHEEVAADDTAGLLGEVTAEARRIGIRLQICCGARRAQQPRFEPVSSATVRAIVAGMAAAIVDFHDRSPGAMVRVAVAPRVSLPASARLLSESAALARNRGVRMHTNLHAFPDEYAECMVRFGLPPVRFLERLGWLHPDVWLGYTAPLTEDAAALLAEAGVAVAYGRGDERRRERDTTPLRRLLDDGIAVGLGLDDRPPAARGGLLDGMRRIAGMPGRPGDATIVSPRETLWMATMGGARCLGRAAELGSLEPGKLGDVALWRLTGPDETTAADPVAAMVLGPRPPLERLFVHGRQVVADEHPRHLNPSALITSARPPQYG
jgi:cytosine/adenosine deaminase-related metal-dependent hydrolase